MKTKLDITEILENFSNDQDVMRTTRKQYYNVIRLFFAWLEMNGDAWKQVRISHIIKFKDRLFDDKKTNRTIRFYLVVIKIFFKWTNKNGIHPNISEGIKLPYKDKAFSKKALSEDQAHRFLANIDRKTKIGKRDYALFFLLFTTGLRSVSVELIDTGDLQIYEGKQVVWFQNKGSRQKDLFKVLTDRTIEAVEHYLLERDGFQDHWPLFATHAVNRIGQRLSRRSMRTIFKKRLADIGIEDQRITLHSTRHTHGVISTRRLGAHEAQLSLNHKSGETTRIYNKHADEDIILQNRTGQAVDAVL